MPTNSQDCVQERIAVMKKIVIAILVLSAGRLYAIAPIGPAASVLDRGQLELGFDYAHTRIDDMPLDYTVEVFGLRAGATVPVSDDVDACFAGIGYGLNDRLTYFCGAVPRASIQVIRSLPGAWAAGPRL